MPRTTQSPAERFARPTDVNGITASMGAARDVYDLMPAYQDIPDEFRRSYGGNPFVKLQQRWFFEGLKGWPLKPKDGINQKAALAHLSAIQRSFEPAHEHKEAGVAYLMSLWFEAPK